ncbi:MAG: hypothetical protein IKJ29_09920 [Akkermansia sp.]|nr:hypothetical protein [Akkermansia sp.]
MKRNPGVLWRSQKEILCAKRNLSRRQANLSPGKAGKFSLLEKQMKRNLGVLWRSQKEILCAKRNLSRRQANLSPGKAGKFSLLEKQMKRNLGVLFARPLARRILSLCGAVLPRLRRG